MGLLDQTRDIEEGDLYGLILKRIRLKFKKERKLGIDTRRKIKNIYTLIEKS